MKKCIFFKILAFGSILIPFSLFTISCMNDRPTNDFHYKFINDLEFSVAGGFSDGRVVLGTAWVYKIINSGDYKYQLITNYHVYEGIANANALFYGFNNYNQKNNKISIQEIVNNQILGQTTDNLNPFFLKTSSALSKSGYMDICSIDISFAGSVAHDIYLKQKLDFINKMENKTTHQVLNINGKKTGHNNKTIYMAGYPWATSDIERDYTYFTEWHDKVDYLETNGLNQFSDLKYNTYQDQYWLSKKPTFPLGGGASGSLVINEDYEAIGIYWGGGQGTNFFIPSFAIFYMGSPISGDSKKYDVDFFYSLNNRSNIFLN